MGMSDCQGEGVLFKGDTTSLATITHIGILHGNTLK